MAIVPWHKNITKKILEEFKFSTDACSRAAIANAKVDKKQGNTPEDTHLHAMLGMVPGHSIRLVPEDRDQGIVQINALIEKSRLDIIREIKRIVEISDNKMKRSYAISITDKIGTALHTVQDKEFHGFEIWRYDGMCSALLNDSLGLVLHGVHDLGMVDLTIDSGSNKQGRVGFSIDIGVTPMRWMPDNDIYFEARGSYQQGGGEAGDLTAMLGLRFGGGGPTRMTRSSFSAGPLNFVGNSGSLLSLKGLKVQGSKSSGSVNNVLDRAEKASRNFINKIIAETLIAPPKARPWADYVTLA